MKRGKVYAYVGVIGSGKSYQASKKIQESSAQGNPVISSDFSDGIRRVLLDIFGLTDVGIDVNSTCYALWKKQTQRIAIPLGKSICFSPIDGRELLKNIGEGLKEIAGEDVWARWSHDRVLKEVENLTEEEKEKCDIVFGSVRFPMEVKTVFSVANRLNKEVQFIFCDYHSKNYSPNIEHISEGLAHDCISAGFKDGDDITEYLYDRYCC